MDLILYTYHRGTYEIYQRNYQVGLAEAHCSEVHWPAGARVDGARGVKRPAGARVRPGYASNAAPPSPRGSEAPPRPATMHWTLLK